MMMDYPWPRVIRPGAGPLAIPTALKQRYDGRIDWPPELTRVTPVRPAHRSSEQIEAEISSNH